MQSKQRILIVDDEADITLFLQKALEKDGNFTVVTFNDPKKAIADFKAREYDMALLDIKMPDMDGFELYQRLQKIDPKIKICFMTAFEVYYEALKELFPDYDSVCFIKKPFSIQDFIRKISREMSGP